ncbi:1,4-dihydroxy-2-naphthoate polyprenyltransferase [Cytophaga aurantiaca]|uniref:1,4-dihydroxy-2-naphthoate polyprenyltransferase n=1 Tax=Cytophaga aurantiaca TaxID=29530 RepID=UPI0003615586|nr:1,4-dihydroxy-2-naphthoate polyprenyltransferase [Cytophaga aurantiaca]
MAAVSHWIKAFRLRTLPLALSSIGMAGFLAYDQHRFNAFVFVGCVLTTLFLQILSNLANDYGDFVNGADSAHRVGPQRAVQSGIISIAEMRSAIIAFSILSLIAGITLLYQVRGLLSVELLIGFLVVGLLAIVAAVTYTSGKRPYGYAGLGDISVFIFFGFVAVCGTYFLQSGNIAADVILPAVSCGLLSTGVLNVNNLRDIDSDKLAGKKSIPVRIGPVYGRYYHVLLISIAWLCATIYVISHYTSIFNFMYLLSLPLFVRHMILVFKTKEPRLLDPYLKQLALSTLVFVITYGVGITFF